MKKNLFTLASALLIGLNCFAYSSPYEEGKKAAITERDQKIYEVTQKDLATFLENIPAGFEKQHGFNSRLEFAKATAGPVYTILGMYEDGKPVAANMFNIPVVVEGEYRAMITVSFSDGVYSIETVGAALLAEELQLLEKEKQPAAGCEKIMLNVYSRTSGFVGYRKTNETVEQTDFIPLVSAKTALENSTRIAKPAYKLAEIVEELIIGK